MHLGWMIHAGDEIYEARARKHGPYYRVVLDPVLETQAKGLPKIEVGTIMKWFNGSWTICGDDLTNYHGVKGMHSGRYAAFHLLQEKGYIGWDRSC